MGPYFPSPPLVSGGFVGAALPTGPRRSGEVEFGRLRKRFGAPGKPALNDPMLARHRALPGDRVERLLRRIGCRLGFGICQGTTEFRLEPADRVVRLTCRRREVRLAGASSGSGRCASFGACLGRSQPRFFSDRMKEEAPRHSGPRIRASISRSTLSCTGSGLNFRFRSASIPKYSSGVSCNAVAGSNVGLLAGVGLVFFLANRC